MSAEARQQRVYAAARYEQAMQALAQEMGAAVQAIASNSLPRLEESVARQEVLCATLPRLVAHFQQSSRATEELIPGSGDGLHAELNAKLRAASRALRDVNLQYAALLKCSGRSLAQLASLCRSHAGSFPDHQHASIKRQTWSCEV